MRKRLAAALASVLALGACAEKGDSSDAKVLILDLSATGQIRADGRAVSLEGLSACIDERTRDAPVERTTYSIVASGLAVVLRVDPDAYWMHVQFMLTVCMEQRIHRTWFEGPGGQRIKVFQPHDAAIEWSREPDRNAVCVTIDIEDGEGADALFRCGERTTHDVGTVAHWVADSLRTDWPGTLVYRVGEIRAPARTRFRHVFAVMEVLADPSIQWISLYGVRIPTPALRRRAVLPSPEAGLSPPSGRGVRAVAYLPDLGWIVPQYDDIEPPAEK